MPTLCRHVEACKACKAEEVTLIGNFRYNEIMRLTLVCPLCGMWVHPNRLNSLKWPVRLFRRIMGGRLPKSKKGIIRYEEMQLPEGYTQLLTWRLEELADHLGYKLVPKNYKHEIEGRLFRYNEVEHERVFEHVPTYIETILRGKRE